MILLPPRPPLFPYTTLFRSAAAYAGISPARALMSVMLLSGGLAGLAGAIEVLGVHYRLIDRSEEHTSELQSHSDLVCRLLLEKKKSTALSGSIRQRDATR